MSCLPVDQNDIILESSQIYRMLTIRISSDCNAGIWVIPSAV